MIPVRELTKSAGFQSAHRVLRGSVWKAKPGVLPVSQLFEVRPASCPVSARWLFCLIWFQNKKGAGGCCWSPAPLEPLCCFLAQTEHGQQTKFIGFRQRRFRNKTVTIWKMRMAQTNPPAIVALNHDRNSCPPFAFHRLVLSYDVLSESGSAGNRRSFGVGTGPLDGAVPKTLHAFAADAKTLANVAGALPALSRGDDPLS